MDLKEYTHLLKTQVWNSSHRTEREQMIHAAMGLSGEAGEVSEWHKKKFFHDRDMTRKDLVEELGDVLYYYTRLMVLHGVAIEEITKANIDKLNERKAKGEGAWEKRKCPDDSNSTS